MKYPMKRTMMFLTATILLGTLSACKSDSGAERVDSVQSQAAASPGTADSETRVTPDLTAATSITLTGSDASVEGKGAEEKDGVITISAAGIYAVSGSLEDGRIIVNAPKEDVTVVLSGTDIACSYGSPLYIYKAATATIYLTEGTENALSDGSVYTFDDAYSSAVDEEPNACLYSKADLVIEGAGKLTVTANCKNGITGKDTLRIHNSNISVTAVNHGITGKDSSTIDSALLTVTCGGDAIRSTNDTDESLGWVTVSDSTLDLTAGEDGIQAETTINLSGGRYTISAGDDAIHADEALAISDGEINVLTSYEGLEGTSIAISGGTIRITSSDDGVNAAGGADGSGFGGFDRGNAFGGGNSDSCITISGGYLVVKAGGDGLDSNGSIVMSGGTVIVSSTGQNDGALDYDGSFTLSGGTLLAVGSGNMPQTPDQASQHIVSLGFDSILSAGTYISLSDGNQSFVSELPIDTNNLVFSSPDLKGGSTYTVSYGGDFSGESVDGICSGGTYSGGTDLTTLTLSDYITTYGNRGMGNMGGRPGRNMDGRPDKNMGDRPEGSFEGRPDGNFGDRPDGSFEHRPDGNLGDRPNGSMGDKPQKDSEKLPDSTTQ